MELKPNTLVNLINGKQVKIIEEIGRGGVAVVYRVKFEGKEKALKWYFNNKSLAYYNKLGNSIIDGTPNDSFLWPECLTKRENGCFGYIMSLRPKGYYSFYDFLCAKYNFESFSSLLEAAVNICKLVASLHNCGYRYEINDEGNLLVNPLTGDVVFVYNDNVVKVGESSGIMGKTRNMAPEIVTGDNKPNEYSDRFSLAVILFMLFYGNHPFEGKRVIACPCMTRSHEKNFYGSEALFIYDETNEDNRPVPGVHNNVIHRWSTFPSLLREVFTNQFSESCLKKPQIRMNEIEWLNIFNQLYAIISVCPICKTELFIDESSTNKCPNCGHSINPYQYTQCVELKQIDKIFQSSRNSNMKLDCALQNAISLYGINILTDSKLINILSDLHAYDRESYKFIVKHMIAYGSIGRLVANASNDSEKILFLFKKEIINLYNKFGFDKIIVADILANFSHAMCLNFNVRTRDLVQSELNQENKSLSPYIENNNSNLHNISDNINIPKEKKGFNGTYYDNIRVKAFKIVMQNKKKYEVFAKRNSLALCLSELSIADCQLIVNNENKIIKMIVPTNGSANSTNINNIYNTNNSSFYNYGQHKAIDCASVKKENVNYLSDEDIKVEAFRIVMQNKKKYEIFAKRNSLALSLSELSFSDCRFILNHKTDILKIDFPSSVTANNIHSNHNYTSLASNSYLQYGMNNSSQKTKDFHKSWTQLNDEEIRVNAYRVVMQNKKKYEVFARRHSLSLVLSGLTIADCRMILTHKSEIISNK